MTQTLFSHLEEPLSLAVSSVQPRPYQRDAHRAFVEAVLRRLGSQLIVLPTGCGKTVLFSFAAHWWLETYGTPVLVLAHRRELITQARDEMAGVLGFSPGVEMAEDYADTRDQVVVASVQTLTAKRLERWRDVEFGLVIVDEAHHLLPTNRTYWRVRERWPDAHWLGVTATAKRGDDVALGQSFEELTYEMSVNSAVEGGWLVPVEQRFVQVTSLDVSEVGTQMGDFHGGDLAKALTGDERTSWEIATAVVQECGDEPTLVFVCPRPAGEPVGQGEQIVAALNRLRPNSAVFLTGETDPDIRARELRRFERREYPYLVGCSLFTEGFNVPAISRVVMGRPTKSIVYYTQCIGRGTRTLRGVLTPELAEATADDRRQAIAQSKKPKLVVLDFVGNSGRHKLLSTFDIFAGSMSSAAVARAKKKAEESGQAVDPQRLMAEAEQEIEREQRAATRVRAKAETRQEVVNPFEQSDSAGSGARAKRTRTDPLSPDQKEWLEQNGGYVTKGMTVGEAGQMMADIKARRAKKQCSPKQQLRLEQLGVLPRGGDPVPKAWAKAWLDWAAALGWPWGQMRRPKRNQLAIRPDGAGYRLTIDCVLVGGTYSTVEEVRKVYQGAALE